MSRPDPYALNTVQRWFQSVITHPEGVAGGVRDPEARDAIEAASEDLEQVITRSGKLDAAGRLAVYANAYYARLLECLAESFPVLSRALGEEAFEGFAFGYLQEHPSRSYTLDHLADRFADYLDRNRPGPDADPAMAEWAAFLVDLARLEWAIEKVFDGPGVESQRLLAPEDLAAVRPEQWAEARLIPVV
ncbi:MAG: DNA-binding domain-containing protein, partial [Phycisphaeraceae bacterium]|nr:DNA-binding domain-containing protein [Phycisphaeraceae bacterium]